MGSEMCIRDRFKRQRGKAEPGRAKDTRLTNMVAMVMKVIKANIESVRLKTRKGIDIPKWKEDSTNGKELIANMDGDQKEARTNMKPGNEDKGEVRHIGTDTRLVKICCVNLVKLCFVINLLKDSNQSGEI